ncbi:MAG: phage major capsid protein [Kangiella sp.]|nr:MAG: phage major capsid protein [Kangiella sp.]
MDNEIANKINQMSNNLEEFQNKVKKELKFNSDSLLHLEQKTSGSFGEDLASGTRNRNSISRQISNSKEVKSFLDRKIKSAGITLSVKDVLPNVRNSTTISTDATNPSQVLPGVVGAPQKRIFLRQLLKNIPVTSSSFTYTRELSFVNNAAAQNGEGTLKAETDITFEEVIGQVSTYAHWLKTSRQVMSDNPALIDFKMTRLQYGLDFKIENAMINGDGTLGDMSGLLNAGNFTTYTPVTGDTGVDSVRKGMLALQKNEYIANLIIMNPDDIAVIETLKDVDGEYIVGKPIEGGLLTMWGVPIHPSNSLATGTFIVLDTEQAVTVHTREEALVEFSNSDNDNFTKNLVTMLAEARLGFAVHLPAGVISGELLAPVV